MKEKQRKREQMMLAFERTGRSEAPKPAAKGAEAFMAKSEPESLALDERVMEEVCERGNLWKALKRVRQNKGSPGVDGMTVDELPEYLRENWFKIRAQLFEGKYRPKPVRRVEIPKPDGGIRKLGIPCVLDRFLQQAISQVLQRKWDQTFSEHSYGFRPERSAHQAIAQAQQYIAEGYNFVVDIDLEKFFDRVNHDILMDRISKRMKDKRMLKIIRAFLNAGVMENGLVCPTTEGTPQGGPLSPLLSNIVLDELDKELERRGHRFCRYADDGNIYVQSEKAGHRVMKSLKYYIEKKLKLKINEAKSAVGRPWERSFLGFSFSKIQGTKKKIAPKALERFKYRVREITKRKRGVKLERVVKELSQYLIGWRAYFGFCDTPRVLRDLDSWIRRRLRSFIWKKWKKCRNRSKELMARGVNREEAFHTAYTSRGPWRSSLSRAMQIACPNKYFDSIGLPRLLVQKGA